MIMETTRCEPCGTDHALPACNAGLQGPLAYRDPKAAGGWFGNLPDAADETHEEREARDWEEICDTDR
jgi:hypothetical protein